jgi:hypothetical protein
MIHLAFKSLLQVKENYFVGRRVVLHSGNIMRLGKDPILENIPFRDQLSALFDAWINEILYYLRLLTWPLIMKPDEISWGLNKFGKSSIFFFLMGFIIDASGGQKYR